MSIDMAQLHRVFFDESQEHLESIKKELMYLDLVAPNTE